MSRERALVQIGRILPCLFNWRFRINWAHYIMCQPRLTKNGCTHNGSIEERFHGAYFPRKLGSSMWSTLQPSIEDKPIQIEVVATAPHRRRRHGMADPDRTQKFLSCIQPKLRNAARTRCTQCLQPWTPWHRIPGIKCCLAYEKAYLSTRRNLATLSKTGGAVK